MLKRPPQEFLCTVHPLRSMAIHTATTETPKMCHQPQHQCMKRNRCSAVRGVQFLLNPAHHRTKDKPIDRSVSSRSLWKAIIQFARSRAPMDGQYAKRPRDRSMRYIGGLEGYFTRRGMFLPVAQGIACGAADGQTHSEQVVGMPSAMDGRSIVVLGYIKAGNIGMAHKGNIATESLNRYSRETTIPVRSTHGHRLDYSLDLLSKMVVQPPLWDLWCRVHSSRDSPLDRKRSIKLATIGTTDCVRAYGAPHRPAAFDPEGLNHPVSIPICRIETLHEFGPSLLFLA